MRFNGAALFQVRKALPPGRSGSSLTRASMGPHSFKCGKRTIDCQWRSDHRSFNGAALFQVRKAYLDFPPSSTFFCFNGAALFQVRKDRVPRYQPLAKQMLQWGRTLSSAERVAPSGKQAYKLVASMGPHSFKCGKSVVLKSTPFAPRASMGPHSFKCGKRPSLVSGPNWNLCFNGAALFQVRKEKNRTTSF